MPIIRSNDLDNWGRALVAIICVVVLCLQLQDPAPAPLKPSGNPQQASAEKQGDPTSSNGIPQPLPASLGNKNSKTTNGDREKEASHENGKPSSGWWGIANANDLLTLLFAGALTWFAYRQTRSMRQQAEYMAHQSRVMEAELEQTRIAANAAKKSAEVSEATVEQIRMEQRAWLSVKFEMTEPGPSEAAKITMHISNTGRTPGAIDRITVTPYVGSIAVDIDRLAIHHAVQAEPSLRQYFVLPGAPMRVPMRVRDLDEAASRAILAGTATAVMFGTVAYRDSQGRSRETQVCFTIDTDTRNLVAHDKYNHMT